MEKLKDCFIVKKDGLYFQTEYSSGPERNKFPKFSASYYDAKKFKNAAEARKMAKKTDGEILRFNQLTGEITKYSQKEDEICDTCRFWTVYSGACCNGKSEHRADFMLPEESCDAWESRKESTW